MSYLRTADSRNGTNSGKCITTRGVHFIEKQQGERKQFTMFFGLAKEVNTGMGKRSFCDRAIERLQRWSDFAIERLKRLQRKGRKISVRISLISVIRVLMWLERTKRLQRWSDFAMERLKRFQRKGRKISVKISLIPAIRQASVSSVFYFGQSDGAAL